MNTKLSTQLKIGRIRYANTLPFYQGLSENGSLKIEEGVPAEINARMRSGELDLAPISSFEYALHPELYYLLPDLCIGATSFSGSVLLISKTKIESLNGKTIALTAESLSAQTLTKILLGKRFDFRNFFVTVSGSPEEMLKQADACLAIGDGALFYRPETFCYKYDLSELWWEWTKLPFCFSVWAVRRKSFDANSTEILEFAARLRGTTRENLANLGKLVTEALGYDTAHERFAPVYSYLSNLKYELNGDMRAGLFHFYQLAAELGAMERPPAFEFIEGV